MKFLDGVEFVDGVYLLSPLETEFEQKYLDVRRKENRVLSDELVRDLPETPSAFQHHNEWKLRQVSTQMVMSRLEGSKYELVLDLGCGNGWFSNKLAEISATVIGVDMNISELKQASRVFPKENLKFCYADIFGCNLPENVFDLITINAAIQYFPDVNRLLNRLLQLLKPSGEIHIIDSSFYSIADVEAARLRSEEYFEGLDEPEMARHYNHHTWDDFASFNHQILYKPQDLKNRITRKLGRPVSPFPWIVIQK